MTATSPTPPAVVARTMATRISEAGLDTERFIDVQSGSKASTDHTPFGPGDVSGNYGIYAGGGLVDIDVDDYGVENATNDPALAAVLDLPETLAVETPHTDGETGGHRFYVIAPGEEFENAREACETVCDATNPGPSWGEVRVQNQYVVGPGSQLDGCSKDWCTECETPAGGHYRISSDRPIATITADELAAVLRADPTYNQDHSEPQAAPQGSLPATREDVRSGRPTKNPTPEAVAAATDCADRYDPNGDRSAQEYHICCVMVRHGVAKAEVEQFIIDQCPGSKVAERDNGIDYGDTWRNAVVEVGTDAGTRTVVSSTSDTDGRTIQVSIPRSSATETDPASSSEEWRRVYALYHDDETTKAEARTHLVRLLDDQESFVAVRDTEELYHYDPESGIYEPGGSQDIGAVLDRRLGAAYSTGERREIISRLKDRNWVARDHLGGPDGMVCVANGVLDLTDPQHPTLREHDPEYMFITRLPTEVDPTPPRAFESRSECPEFATFLDDVVRAEDLAKLQEFAGYCLLAWDQPYKRALVCLGPTDSGKSTFLSVIRTVLGGANVAGESLYELVQTRWGTANLYGAVANIRNELSPGDLKYPQQFKELTSGRDAINAERKGEDKFTFVPTAKHLFAANQVPSVDYADDAFYNRWLFVTFPTSVPRADQDHDLADRLGREEASGILNWMVAGYARLVDQGGFTEERGLGEKEEMWQAYGDGIDRFVNRCLEVTGESRDRLPKGDTHAAYTAMCDDLGLASERQKTFTEELEQRSGVADSKPRTPNVRVVLPHDEKRVLCYTGVQLTDEGRAFLDTCVTGDNPTDEDTPTHLSEF